MELPKFAYRGGGNTGRSSNPVDSTVGMSYGIHKSHSVYNTS